MIRQLLDSLFFTRAKALIRIGRVRPIESTDYLPLPEQFSPASAVHAFDVANTGRFGTFLWQVFWAVGRPSWNVLLCSVLYMVFVLSAPLLLAHVLRLLPEASAGRATELYATAIALGLSGMLGALAVQHFYYNALKGFATVVNGINNRVVRQALRLRHSARSTMRTGDLVNHLSSDTDAIAEGAFFIPEAVSGLLRTLVGLALLWSFLGVATLASFLVLIALTPVALAVARRYRSLDHQLMGYRDERITLMSQILQGIRVVKFQAWEDAVHADVASVRSKEINTRIRIVATDALSTALFISVTTLVAFTGFATFVMLGGTLTAPTIFACLSLFAILEEPFGMVSHLLANLQHARVATERLHEYFSAATRDEDERETTAPSQPIGCSAEKVSLRYPDAHVDALHQCTLHVQPGEAIAIVGGVGAGKSTLLRTLAGLHVVSSGLVKFDVPSTSRPRMAYVPQEAFILNATVADNIVFGYAESTDEQRLTTVVQHCALQQDLDAMSAGLATEIGERGVNLSGGQKQRIALARAAYSQPGIVFLDDPLSAVDASTEHHLVNTLLFGEWQSITRIVVTHRLEHLQRFDRIVVMDHGSIVALGTYDAVKQYIPELPATSELSSTILNSANTVHELAVHSPLPSAMEEDRFMSDEDRDTGAVRNDVYKAYARAVIGSNPITAPLIAALLLVTTAGITVLPILQTWWLGYWADGRGLAQSMDALTAVGIFGLIGIVVLLGWIVERLAWLWRAAAAGRTLHDQALEGVLRATIRFFDTTPIGRVLNRFARDQEAVDDHLSWNLEQSFKSLAQTIGSLILVVSVVPVVSIVFIPVLWLYYRLQRDYRSAAREAKRLESIARSPRYAQFKEMVTGLDVIHGFGRERYFYDDFLDILTNYQRSYYTSILLNRWFSVRVPMISGVVGLTTSIVIVYLAQSSAITAGMAGLVLTYALSFWGNLNWTVRAFSEVESRMTSVERLHTYSKLAPEPQTTRPQASDATLVHWPSNGEISIRNLSVRYAPVLPRILHDVSVHIPARSKVGITGRTGSGKSTLFQSLFRFVEPEHGSIEIDGVDIASVPLGTLRRALAIIPQDPTLFLGTIRSNLDRYNLSSDVEVWTSLRRVHLDQHIRSLPRGLNSMVTEGGLNFSQGQRQLLCMARALLSQARIIVLDEATASVDLATDALIQQTVREEFTHATVLVIAHRAETVADSDIQIELAAGRVVKERRATTTEATS